MPLFSVIIPTKNRASLLKEAIASVLRQSHEDFELIVIDDHSVDETINVIDSFHDERIKYALNKSEERSAARNTGIDIAVGEYICFLDDDDYYTENYLKDFYEYLVSYNYPKNIILRTGFVKLYENSKEIKSRMYDETKHKNPSNFVAYNMCGIGVCVPKNIFSEHKFDVRFPHWQDTHLILRILEKNHLIQHNSYNYIYRIHKLMGSGVPIDEVQLEKKCEINVAAMRDFFLNYNTTSTLPPSTCKILIAEKYLQYAITALQGNHKNIPYLFLNRSLKCTIRFRFIKLYLLFTIFLIKNGFKNSR